MQLLNPHVMNLVLEMALIFLKMPSLKLQFLKRLLLTSNSSYIEFLKFEDVWRRFLKFSFVNTDKDKSCFVINNNLL